MRRVVIIQARMTSTRLPGKVLLNLAGRPMLSQQVQRLKACQRVDEIVIATTTNATDDPVIELARQDNVGWFRGSESDVLARYVGAAQQAQAGAVVRITADCPLIDPQLVDRALDELNDYAAECDYVSNVIKRTYPRGLDVEAFFFDTLLRVNRLAQSSPAREHVTVVVRSEKPELFLTRDIVDRHDNSDLRWTVDTPVDFEVIRQLYDFFDLGTKIAPYSDMITYVRAHPDLARLNTHIDTWNPG
ncbi:MAG: glycosyltransferase family protein [Chloroflexi bacterium]|nr:glycosyltransferase family protein [Chloroflexota bacterium]